MILRKFVAGPALADHHNTGINLTFENRLDDAAMAVERFYSRCAGCFQSLFAGREQYAPTFDLKPCISFLDLRQFLKQLRLDAKPDRSRQIVPSGDGILAL